MKLFNKEQWFMRPNPRVNQKRAREIGDVGVPTGGYVVCFGDQGVPIASFCSKELAEEYLEMELNNFYYPALDNSPFTGPIKLPDMRVEKYEIDYENYDEGMQWYVGMDVVPVLGAWLVYARKKGKPVLEYSAAFKHGERAKEYIDLKNKSKIKDALDCVSSISRRFLGRPFQGEQTAKQ